MRPSVRFDPGTFDACGRLHRHILPASVVENHEEVERVTAHDSAILIGDSRRLLYELGVFQTEREHEQDHQFEMALEVERTRF